MLAPTETPTPIPMLRDLVVALGSGVVAAGVDVGGTISVEEGEREWEREVVGLEN